jgi:hypothetical protein
MDRITDGNSDCTFGDCKSPKVALNEMVINPEEPGEAC